MDCCRQGAFWLLEACRESAPLHLILLGGDPAWPLLYRFPAPVSLASSTPAYPGCYALSNVLEEVMLEQSLIHVLPQRLFPRAPWIMEKTTSNTRSLRR